MDTQSGWRRKRRLQVIPREINNSSPFQSKLAPIFVQADSVGFLAEHTQTIGDKNDTVRKNASSSPNNTVTIVN